MTPVVNQRMTARLEGDFVVFLIGMRLNQPWQVAKWWPLMMVYPQRMMAELLAQPELGYLGGESWVGRTTIMVQYWRSFEQLERYARAPEHAHLPAWKAFNQAIGSSGVVGVWHETYLVAAGRYEALYHNMPRFGLAAAGEHLAVRAKAESARERLGGGIDTGA